jgi:hypothetical protein
MFIKCLSNNELAFKIIIGRVIDQMIILKSTSLFNGHLMDIYMTCRITHYKIVTKLKEIFSIQTNICS